MSTRSKTWFRGAGRVLWIASTPIALTLLLAAPARAQHEEHGGSPNPPGFVATMPHSNHDS